MRGATGLGRDLALLVRIHRREAAVALVGHDGISSLVAGSHRTGRGYR
jgi:hypothetical protein